MRDFGALELVREQDKVDFNTCNENVDLVQHTRELSRVLMHFFFYLFLRIGPVASVLP